MTIKPLTSPDFPLTDLEADGIENSDPDDIRGASPGPQLRPPLDPAYRRTAAPMVAAAISCNLLRAACALASLAHTRTRSATLRRDLIKIAARTARHGRGRGRITLHLPEGWHREHEWRACSPPPAGHPRLRPDQLVNRSSHPPPHGPPSWLDRAAALIGAHTYRRRPTANKDSCGRASPNPEELLPCATATGFRTDRSASGCSEDPVRRTRPRTLPGS
jgi:hypothetical protein